jgi:hypothetical protein
MGRMLATLASAAEKAGLRLTSGARPGSPASFRADPALTRVLATLRLRRAMQFPPAVVKIEMHARWPTENFEQARLRVVAETWTGYEPHA